MHIMQKMSEGFLRVIISQIAHIILIGSKLTLKVKIPIVLLILIELTSYIFTIIYDISIQYNTLRNFAQNMMYNMYKINIQMHTIYKKKNINKIHTKR